MACKRSDVALVGDLLALRQRDGIVDLLPDRAIFAIHRMLRHVPSCDPPVLEQWLADELVHAGDVDALAIGQTVNGAASNKKAGRLCLLPNLV